MDFNFYDAPEKTLFQLIAGWIGNALALFFFISPSVVIYQLITNKLRVNKVPWLIFAANILNCFLWFNYGWRREDIQIYMINFIGGVLGVIYLIFFWYYKVDRRILRFLLLTVLTLIFNALLIYAGLFWFKSNEINGKSAMVVNVVMYGAPGQNLYLVFKTGNFNLIAIVSSIMGFFCSSFWFIYAFLDNINIDILIPNSMGIIFSIIQIVVYNVYKRKAKNSPELQKFLDVTDDEVTPMVEETKPTC